MIEVKQNLEGDITSINQLEANINVGTEKIPPVLQEKTIDPDVTEQTILPDENYNGLSKVIVQAVDSSIDSNIVPQNIAKGVEILGVEGILEAPNFEIDNTAYLFYQGYRENRITDLLPYCKNVKNMTNMFSSCKFTNLNLENLDMTQVENLSYFCSGCSRLTEIIFGEIDTSKVTNISFAFNSIAATTFDLSKFNTTMVTNSSYLFNGVKLTTLIIDRQDIFKMTNKNMLNATPIASGTGYVYVPDNMVEAYKSATNWSTYADQIKGLSELEGYYD